MTRGLVFVSSTNVIFSIDTHAHTRVSMKDKTSYLPFILIHMLNIYRGIYSHLPLNGDDFSAFKYTIGYIFHFNTSCNGWGFLSYDIFTYQ
jgi:hypothetical protein